MVGTRRLHWSSRYHQGKQQGGFLHGTELPPRHGGSVRCRVCERSNSDFNLQHPTSIIRERIDFRIRWCCDQREGDVVRYRNMSAGRQEAIDAPHHVNLLTQHGTVHGEVPHGLPHRRQKLIES